MLRRIALTFRRPKHFAYGSWYCSRYSDSLRTGCSGIESRWRRDFPHPSRPALGPTQSPVRLVPSLFHGFKAVGTWRWPPTPSSAEVKERVQLYFSLPPFWVFMACSREIFTFFTQFCYFNLPFQVIFLCFYMLLHRIAVLGVYVGS
jgi:hypothetical protein